jgi:microsomal dipeptidase-like Zn-dependent dipeptidase
MQKNNGDTQMKQLATSIRLSALLILLSGFLATSAMAGTCGGINQRACCFGERAGAACDAGLVQVAKGEYPSACLVGADTCLPRTPVTPCGGEGQRNCCLGEGDNFFTCDANLEEQTDALPHDLFEANSGDASCSGQVINGSRILRSRGTCIKPVLFDPTTPSISEPKSGWTKPTQPRHSLSGYMDMHLHLAGRLAHGGKVLSGESAPIDADGNFVLNETYNINTALSPVKDLELHKTLSHGLLNDTAGDGTYDGTRSWYGAPYFSGWPKWTSTTHQQTYYVWLERAWRGGLRAISMLGVQVEALCKTSRKATRETSWPDCENEMKHVLKQLQAAYDFQKFVDDNYGVDFEDGKGWFRIVTTPKEARDVIRSGKLAVVLGIEMDNLFNCKNKPGADDCPADFGLPKDLLSTFPTFANLEAPTNIEEAVDVIYEMGVRQVFPVHNFDNGFGAAATWMDAIAVGQAVTEQRWWETEDCGNDKGDYGFWINNANFPLMLFMGFGLLETPAIPVYTSGLFSPAYASCNKYGLRAGHVPTEEETTNERKPGGKRLIQALMNKGILIDIDHMSIKSLNETIALTKTSPGSDDAPYPLIASHVQFFDLHQKEFIGNAGRHERMRTKAQLEAIKGGGGMIAAMLKDDVQDTDLKGGKYTVPYKPPAIPDEDAIADNCRHSSKTWAQALQYGVDTMGGPVAMGSDFNGAAGHVGPRFGSDACGGWGADNGSERVKQIVEDNKVAYPFILPGFGKFDKQVTGFKTFDYNVDGLAHVGLLPDMIADLEKIGLGQNYVDELFCSAEAFIRVWERADALANSESVPDPSRLWLCKITDDTPPVSTVSLAPAAQASGWHQDTVTATITATDADSGVDQIDYTATFGAQVDSGSQAGAQATVTLSSEGNGTLSYFATDKAGNDEDPNSLTVKIDRTAPGITAALAPAANAGGWNNSAVTVSFTCTDALSGIQSCTAPQTLSSEGASQSATGEAVDNADNSANVTLADIHIDKTPPVVEITGITDGAVYIVGNVPEAGCSTSDALSGVETNAVVAVTGGTSNNVATFSVTCSGARDVAGNTNSASATYDVHYPFSEFAAPVETPPVLNKLKAGKTVPLKFGLGGDYGLDVLPGGAPTSIRISCASLAAVDDLEETGITPGKSLFSYDPLTSLYQFNWKTAKNWSGTCRRLLLRLDDGTVHAADFKFK